MGFRHWLAGVLGVLPEPPAVPVVRLPQTIHRSSQAVTNARRDAILQVLGTATRPLTKKEIVSRVRAITLPPVQPPPRDGATGHLLHDRPLKDMVECHGHSHTARWVLRSGPAANGAVPALNLVQRTMPRHASAPQVEVLTAARAILVRDGDLPFGLLAERVRQRLAPYRVSDSWLLTVMYGSPQAIVRIGQARSSTARWHAL